MSNSKNKFTKLNINNEFKGKSAEIQAKTTIRPNQTGLQTLGKAVSARRMPKPANLPSLRSENAIISTPSSTATPTTTTSSSSSRLLLNNQQQLTSSIINQNNNNQSNEQTWNDNHQNDEQQHNSSITRQTWSTNNYTNSNSNSLDVNYFILIFFLKKKT
jgi:hypothetical protein